MLSTTILTRTDRPELLESLLRILLRSSRLAPLAMVIILVILPGLTCICRIIIC